MQNQQPCPLLGTLVPRITLQMGFSLPVGKERLIWKCDSRYKELCHQKGGAKTSLTPLPTPDWHTSGHIVYDSGPDGLDIGNQQQMQLYFGSGSTCCDNPYGKLTDDNSWHVETLVTQMDKYHKDHTLVFLILETTTQSTLWNFPSEKILGLKRKTSFPPQLNFSTTSSMQSCALKPISHKNSLNEQMQHVCSILKNIQ